MADLTKEQMVEFITREVMKMLGMDEEEPEDKSCCPDALVIGEADKLPPAVRRQYQLKSLDTYKGDITPYEKIFITGITRMELADIALGRDSDAAACAVIEGLLHGTEIFLYDVALTHRKHAGRGSRAFYQLLEGYVRTLQSYGIKLVQGTTVIDKYEKHAAPGAKRCDHGGTGAQAGGNRRGRYRGAEGHGDHAVGEGYIPSRGAESGICVMRTPGGV